ncbi:hypothetical protein [Salisediminibacterium selenitireducens]|uniref:Uncharacterized protein n=1 Tax=Bacillus selenitireducens (strain ATCC 700615 / DSM 15326 / MLS10) TaxID=439292 RepID=D6XSM4_BACIE|nr:hypothetical protein [Salisediminibacterium selenitireducens]ADH98810.1 hypothetical protein Bsel_1298 [[Bacillus] selenitireducens MLS10]
MTKKKKANHSQPKRHRYQRKHRLKNVWKIESSLETVNNRVRFYAKYYGVHHGIAARELEMLGYTIRDNGWHSMEQRDKQQQRRQQQKRLREEEKEPVSDWDGRFSFIAGYTSGGVPYGTEKDLDDS